MSVFFSGQPPVHPQPHQQGRPPNIRRRGSFDNSEQNRSDDVNAMGMGHPYSTINGRTMNNEDQFMNRPPGRNMGGESQKVMDYAAATLPRGPKRSQVANHNQKSFNIDENPNNSSMERRRRGNNPSSGEGNSQFYRNDVRRSGNEPRPPTREPVHNFGHRIPNQNSDNYQNFSRRQESETSTLAASYDPYRPPYNHKFQRPYQITPDSHRHSGSSVSQIDNHPAISDNFPQPPMSLQPQQQNQPQESIPKSLMEFGPRKDGSDVTELENNDLRLHDDDLRVRHEQTNSTNIMFLQEMFDLYVLNLLARL